MARKLSLLSLVASLAALTVAPNAGAVGLQGQRVVAAKPTTLGHLADTMIAPATACPGQTDLGAPTAAQEEAMRCMTAYARLQAGLPDIVEAEALDVSAAGKADDVLRCDDFSHFACGREFTYWMKASGYLSAPCWRAGENLAWGTGSEGSVRSIFRAWMRSSGHRRNILGNFDQIGIGLRVGELGGRAGTRVWTQHFGSRCE